MFGPAPETVALIDCRECDFAARVSVLYGEIGQCPGCGRDLEKDPDDSDTDTLNALARM